MNINKLIKSAFKDYQAGRLIQSEHAGRQILKKEPNNVNILNLLGVIWHRRKNYDYAIKYFERALQLEPGFVDVYVNLGLVCQEKGNFDEAITYFRKALQINPCFAVAYYNLGYIFHERNQLAEAITYYKKAAEYNPTLFEAYYNIGNALAEKKQLHEAIIYYQKSIQLNTTNANAYNNLGNVLKYIGQLDGAIINYRKAIALNPLFIEPYCNLGNALREKKQFDEAVLYYQKALQLDPADAAIYYNLGVLMKEQGRNEEAIAVFDKALDYDADLVVARWARCMSQLFIIYPGQRSIQISRECYHDELIKLRDTINLSTPSDIQAASEAVGSHQPFFLACQGSNDRELQKIYGELVCKIMALKYSYFAESRPPSHHLQGEPIRVGLVSRHFYRHSVWKIPLKGWIENLDERRFSLYGYSTGTKKDSETEVARRAFYRFIEDVYSFEELCEIIRGDNLHILIYPEIGMDPMSVRLAALRLAPVQCTAMGHPDTSGLPTIDYYLSSDLMEPPDADSHYTEKLVRLPNLSIYYTPLDVPEVSVNRDSFGLDSKSVLYLCSHALFTYLPQYDDVFPRIAKQVIGCQFLFISDKSKFVTEQFSLRIKKAFARFEINADNNVVFLPRLDPGRYHAINCLSDIFLDSIGWSANNSTFEAIACNLPVVTLPGELMWARHAAAILTMMGMTETIASSADEYVELAVRLGNDSKWRRQIYEKIASHKHLIYRDMACIKALEDFLEKVVREIQTGNG